MKEPCFRVDGSICLLRRLFQLWPINLHLKVVIFYSFNKLIISTWRFNKLEFEVSLYFFSSIIKKIISTWLHTNAIESCVWMNTCFELYIHVVRLIQLNVTIHDSMDSLRIFTEFLPLHQMSLRSTFCSSGWLWMWLLKYSTYT